MKNWKPRRKPTLWFERIDARDSLADIRLACNTALKKRGLNPAELLRPERRKAAR